MEPIEHHYKEPIIRRAWEVAQLRLGDTNASDEEALNDAAVLMGYMMGYAHLYSDGNGRLGRLVFASLSTEIDASIDNIETILDKHGNKYVQLAQITQADWLVADKIVQETVDGDLTDFDKAVVVACLMSAPPCRALNKERYSDLNKLPEAYIEPHKYYRENFREFDVEKRDERWEDTKLIFISEWLNFYEKNDNVEIGIGQAKTIGLPSLTFVPPQTLPFRTYINMLTRSYSEVFDKKLRTDDNLEKHLKIKEQYDSYALSLSSE